MSIKHARQETINNNLREYFDPMKKQHKGLPGHNKNNTIEHELKKYEIAMKLEREGCQVIIEGILNNGLRPDVTVLDVFPPICYEVMKSEEQISDRKRTKYPGRIVEVKI